MPLTKFTPTTIEINGRSLTGLKPVRKGTGSGAFAISGGITLSTGTTGTSNGSNFANLIIRWRYLSGGHEVRSSTSLGNPNAIPLQPLPPITDVAVSVIT